MVLKFILLFIFIIIIGSLLNGSRIISGGTISHDKIESAVDSVKLLEKFKSIENTKKYTKLFAEMKDEIYADIENIKI